MRLKNPNVAEQNDALAEEMVGCTTTFRNRAAGYPAALYDFLAAAGVDVSRSVLVSVSTAEQGVNPICGMVVTQHGRFMEFDLDCSKDGLEALEVHVWTDETDTQNFNTHNPGFGKGVGRIALEVSRQSGEAG